MPRFTFGSCVMFLCPDPNPVVNRRDYTRGMLQYTGVDQSATMADRAAAKLQPYMDRVDLRLTNGAPTGGTEHMADASVDRYLSTYVLDLLSEDDVSDNISNNVSESRMT
eukprot:2553349-Pyramimonas_sp.AAC.1